MTHPPFMTDPASLFCLLFTPPPLAQNFPHTLFQCSFNKHLSISGVAPAVSSSWYIFLINSLVIVTQNLDLKWYFLKEIFPLWPSKSPR